MARKIKILTDVDGKQDLAVSGALTVKADSTFVIPSISTSSDGFYSLNNAIHKIDQSLQEVNARVVSSVGNVLGQYNASRYVFSGYFDASGSATINITRGSPSGSVYFKESDIGNLSVNILTDLDGDGIFTNNLIPFQLRPSSGDLFLDISARSAPYVMYKATVTNDAAIVDIPAQNNVYLVSSGSSTVDAQTVLLDSTKLYNKSIRNLYVSPTGSDDNDGLTLTSSFATIQKAVDSIPTYNNSAATRVQYHTIINIASGSYTERVNILNKGYAGNDSNLLMLFKGATQAVYENLSPVSQTSTDPDSGTTNGFRSLTLNFPTAPADNSLKGLYINRRTSAFSSDILITGNSGSTIHTNNITYSSYFGYSDYYIARNVSTVNGYFRSAGNQGVISFKNINLNVPLNDGGGTDTYFFSSVYHPVGVVDENNSGQVAGTGLQARYGSYTNDEIRVASCNVINLVQPTGSSAARIVLGPKTYLAYVYFSSSYNDASIYSSYNQVDSFNAVACYFENIGLTFTSVPLIDLRSSFTSNCSLTFTSCDSVTLPRKMISNKASGNRVASYSSRVSSNPNDGAYYKSIGFDGYNQSYLGIVSPMTVHGPFYRFINLTNNTFMDFGAVNTTSSFSGSSNSDYLVLATNKSNINFNSTLDLRSVYSPSANPLIGSFKSDMSINYQNPLFAVSGSANYKSTGDFRADDKNYFYSELPIITAETTKIDNRLNIANTKMDYQYPIETTKNITLTGSAQLISSLVKLTPYSTLPSGSLGLMAVSGTTLYFHNGTSWTAVT